MEGITMFKVKMKSIIGLMLATALISVMGMTACSSSGGDDGGTPASASAVSIGTMTKGSVIVNGVTFVEDNLTRITGDDTAKASADLQTGMTVRVRGRVNSDDVSGTAERVEIENEVRGAIEAKAGDTITVHGQTVMVDGATVFANGTPSNNLAGLAVADNVEVHGQRDAAGVIRATRVQELGAGTVDDELRGTVSGLTGNLVLGNAFNIGALTIPTTVSTAVTPTGAVIANGILVEVHLNANGQATRIHLEDGDDDFDPAEGEEFEVEGFVEGCPAGNACGSSFKVNNQQVQTSSTTRLEGGVKNDLVNDVKVEAEGHLSGGILVANKIAFKETVRIEANVTAMALDSATVLGKTVVTTSRTDLSSAGTVTVGDGVRIRGFLNNDGSITAMRVEKRSNPVDADKNILQGPVTSKDAANKKMVILGITIDASGVMSRISDDSPDDSDVAFANIDAFFAAVTPGRTIVKAKGTVSGSTISATEIEIE
jgi:hypothetical protein